MPPIARFRITYVEGDKFRSPERAGEPEQQNRAITQALHVGVGQAAMATTLSAVAGVLRTGALPIVRRMPCRANPGCRRGSWLSLDTRRLTRGGACGDDAAGR